MNRHTELSVNQPFLEKLNKLVYKETFKFDFYDLNSLKFWISEIEKEDSSSKFNFEIKIKDGKCSLEYLRIEREGERPSNEVLKKILESNGFLIVNVLNNKKNESFNLKETTQQFEKFSPLKPMYGLGSQSIESIPTLTTNFLFSLTSSSIPALSTNFINSLTFP